MNRKVLINIAFIGNRKSGKSTTIGHLLYSTGIINQNEFIKIYNQSIEYGYPSYRYSFLINTYKEKQCLTTMIFHIKKFETKKYDFNLIDLPGYFKYRKNMIKGVSLADAAVIVISAENEQSKNDNIKGYLIIAYTMRIRQLIFAINKMDEIKYSEEIFLKIKKNMINLCISIGFNLDDIQFIPYSGFTGQNLVNKYEDEDILKINQMDWYKGKTILESLDELKPPKRFLDEPLIISNFHVDKVYGVGTVLERKILLGKLKIGMELCIPTVINKINDIFKIECNTIGMYNNQIKEAISGDIIGFNVKGITKPQGKLSKLVFTINSKSIINADNLRAKIFMINKKVSIRIGSVLTLFCYTQNILIKIEKIEYLVSEADKILEKEPKEIHCGESAIFIMKLIKRELNNWNWYKARLCYFDKYKNNQFLGSFLLFNDKLAAVGNIKDINV